MTVDPKVSVFNVKPGVITPLPGHIEFPFRKVSATTAAEVKKELDDTMERKGEGLILKRLDSPYIPNSRSFVWTKARSMFTKLNQTSTSAYDVRYCRFTDQTRLLCASTPARLEQEASLIYVPPFQDELGETCDLQVLGGWYGTRSRGNRVSSLLCGLRMDNAFDSNGTPRFVS